MILLADECVDFYLITTLRTLGYQVDAVRELSRGAPDSEVLRTAVLQDRVLLTEDLDYGTLVFRDGRPALGVLLLRLDGLTAPEKMQVLTEALSKIELEGYFTTLSPTRIRQRQLQQLRLLDNEG